MKELLEIARQIQELSGVAVDALTQAMGAEGGDKPEGGEPPQGGGEPPKGDQPPVPPGR